VHTAGAAVESSGRPEEPEALHTLAGRRWADAFDMDVLACPRCGGRLRLLALLEKLGAVNNHKCVSC
jgi:hypothetical protein